MSTPIAFKAFPELSIEDRDDESCVRIVDSKGETLVMDVNGDMAVLQRLVDCWNACRKLYNPAAHIEESEAYTKRVEGLRRAAWDEVQVLRAGAAPTQPEHAA